MSTGEKTNEFFLLEFSLANKHGIFDPSSVSSVSSANLPSLQGNLDSTNESNLQHPFTVISTLLHNGHEDLSSSPNSPSSDLLANHRPTTDDDENETELSSLRHEMNGVLAGDEDNSHHHDQGENGGGDDDDDEQDGTNSNSLMNLPQKIATILCNDNNNKHSLSIYNDNDDEQQDMTNNSPTNSLDYPQQAASSSQTTILPLTSSSTTSNITASLSRQSSTKLAEDFCDICQKHFCNKYYLRVSFRFFILVRRQYENSPLLFLSERLFLFVRILRYRKKIVTYPIFNYDKHPPVYGSKRNITKNLFFFFYI